MARYWQSNMTCALVDLRTEEERREKPDAAIPNARHIPVDLTLGAREKTKARGAPAKLETADEAREWMLQAYREMVCPQVAGAYRAVLDIVLEAQQGAVLFHCFSGKDRTGMVAAMLLTLLGVSGQDIMADYLETNRLRAAANRALFEQGNYASVQTWAAFNTAMMVQPSFLQCAWDTAKTLYGGWEQYLLHVVGVSGAEVDRLREKYLEPVQGAVP